MYSLGGAKHCRKVQPSAYGSLRHGLLYKLRPTSATCNLGLRGCTNVTDRRCLDISLFRCKESEIHEVTVLSGVFGGGRWCDRPPFDLTMDFWIICTVFVRFLLRLNRVKSMSHKASSDCPCFLPVKNCVKMHRDVILGTKIIFFLGRGPAPSTMHTHPSRRLRRLAPSLLKS